MDSRRYAALLFLMQYLAEELRELEEKDALVYAVAAIAIVKRHAQFEWPEPEPSSDKIPRYLN